MDSLIAKHRQLLQALTALDESISLFKRLCARQKGAIDEYGYDQVYRAFRESMIQRFEFCTELFWKYVKMYTELIAEQTTEYNAPAPVIRAAFSAGVLNEQEAEHALEMIKDRNRTSHIYKEEIAEELTVTIPTHAALMNTVAKRLTPSV